MEQYKLHLEAMPDLIAKVSEPYETYQNEIKEQRKEKNKRKHEEYYLCY